MKIIIHLLTSLFLLFSLSAQAIEIKIEKKEEKIKVFVNANNETLNNKITGNLSKIQKIKLVKKPHKRGFNFYVEDSKNKSFVKFNNITNVINDTSIIDRANHISDMIYKEVFKEKSFFKENLVFVKKEQSRYKLVKTDYEGDNSRVILVSPEPIISPDISANQEYVTYVSFEKVRPAIYLHNIKTHQRRIIAQYSGVNGYPKISNDNKKVLMSLSKNGDANLYEYIIASNTLKKITNEAGNEISPEWINDNTILFASDRAGNPRVYQLTKNTMKSKMIFKSKKYTLSPSYNKDYIISLYANKGFFGLLKYNNKTNKETNILKDFYVESPSISKNGNLIVYATKENNRSILKFIDINGNPLYTLRYKNSEIIEPSF